MQELEAPALDTITAIQDLMDKTTVIMYTAIGVLSQNAPLMATSADIPVTHWTAEQVDSASKACESLAHASSRDIVLLSKEIDKLLDQLLTIAQPVESDKFQNLQEENEHLGSDLDLHLKRSRNNQSQLERLLRKITDNEKLLFKRNL